VLQAPRVAAWRSVAWAKQVERTTHDVGRGRGAASRQQRERATIRSPITPSARRGAHRAALTTRCGWHACVTKAGQPRRSLEAAVLGSRNADRVERLLHRRTSRGPIAPLFVKLHDHIAGLTSLLT